MNESQIAAIRAVARKVNQEFKSWTKAQRDDVEKRTELFQSYRAKYLHNSISETLFKHYVGVESGVIQDRSAE